MGDRIRNRLRGLLNARCLLAIAGFALYWPMFRRPFIGSVFSNAGPALYDALLLFHMALLALGFVLALAPRESSAVLVRRPIMVLAGALCMMIGAAVICFSRGASDIAGFAAVGACCMAFGFVGLTVHGALLCRSLVSQAPLVLTTSFLLSFAMGTIEPFPPLFRASLFCLPAGCGICFFLSERSSSRIDAVGNAASRAEAASEAGALRPYAAVILAAALLAGACIRSDWMYAAVGYSASTNGVFTYLISVLIATVLFAMVLFIEDRRMALFGCFFVVLACLLTSVIGCTLLHIHFGRNLVTSSFTSIEFVLWMCLMVRLPDTRRSVVAAGVFLCIDDACLLATNFLIPRILDIGGETAAEMLLPLGLVATSAVLIAAFVLLAVIAVRMHDRSADQHARFVREETPSGNGRAQAALEVQHEQAQAEPFDIVARFGLTEREAAVAACLAQGNSVKRTAELLYIAPSTVQGFSKSIYRKMNIHSKQELIDAFRGNREG